jgi:basic amino acid/polyamine antiporter, APA family
VIHSPERARRPVGRIALLALGINGIVGVGIFFAPAEVARAAPGWSSVVVFALTGLALIPVAVTIAILGARFDEDGGPVVFARAAFGPLSSFVVGWVTYVSAVFSTTAVMAGLTSAVLAALGLRGPGAERVCATALATVLALVCAAGISLSARVWTGLTILKLVPLLALAAVFLAQGMPVRAAPTEGVTPVAWPRAALTATFTYQGFEIVPVVAGQVRSSASAIPFAIAGSLGLAGLLYVTLQAACVTALPQLASSSAPLADAAAFYAGPGLAWLVTAGTSISALGISFGMVATTPRYLSALAVGASLPFELDRVAGNGVPLRALAATWLLVVAVIQVGSRGEFFALSSIAVLAQFVVTALALAALALRRQRGLVPRQAWWSLPTIVIGLVLTAGATSREWLVAACALALGLGLRWLTSGRPATAPPS